MRRPQLRLVDPAKNGHRKAPRALTAAGDLGGSGSILSGGGAAAMTPSRQAWQSEAWGYWDAVPELHYGGQFVGSCMSRIKLRLGWRNDANEIDAVFQEDGNIDPDCPVDSGTIALASVVLGAFRDILGGQAALLEQIGKNLTAVGDCHLLAQDLHDEAGQLLARRWEVLSTDELRRKGSVKRDKAGNAIEPEFERVWGGGRPNEPIPPEAFVLRIYRRHPRWSRIADASTRPLLDIMENIVLIARQLRATTLSRLAGAGILWIPTEIDFPDDETAPPGSEEDDPFTRTLIRNMTQPITDRGAASSVVPLVVRADADLIPAIHHLTFDTKDDEVALKKMDALIQRFAQGMDLPVEVVLGHQRTTFANAVQVDEATFKAHLEPLIELVCAYLTAGYLWPSLGAKKPVDAPLDEPILLPAPDEDFGRLCITWDASNLVTHLNREKNVIEALKMEPPLIGRMSALRALGFNEGDALTDEELDRWIRVRQLIQVRESIRAEDTGGGGVNLDDPDVQDALDVSGQSAASQADDANKTVGV